MLKGIDSNPTMSRIYGNPYVTQIERSQASGSIGALVPSGIFGTHGSLDASAQVGNAQAVAINAITTGQIATVFNNGTNSYMVQYTAQGTVDTNFATDTSNVLTLSNLANPAFSLITDEQGRFLVAGDTNFNDGSHPWIRRITSAGVVDTSFAFADGASWTAGGSIHTLATQTSGKIVAVGFNGTNGMLARYNLDGSIDTTFGVAGYVPFNGVGLLPTSIVGLRTLVIDAENNMYIAYTDQTPSVYVIRLTAHGAVDTTWNSGSPVHMSYLDADSMVQEQLNMICNAVGDLVIAVPSGNPTVIKAASIQSATGMAGSFANFMTSGGVFGSDAYALFNTMATSDSKVYFLGSNTVARKMAIICCTNAGILHTDFNASGVNFFNATDFVPSVYANAHAGSIAPNGQIFIAGAQLNTGVTTPYISSLYNNQYVTSVEQFPATQEQGTRDSAFGHVDTQTYPGVVSPFIGLYRASLQQKAEVVTELASGSVLVGMNGYNGIDPAQSNMMLVRLLATGAFDNSFGFSGQLVLPNLTNSNEYVTSIVEDGSANLYITGYSDVGAIFRKYSADGMLLWNSDYLVAGYQGLASQQEGATRILLFLGGPSQTGQVNAYLTSDGTVDTTFHQDGSTQGQLLTTDFNLYMGPLYSSVVDGLGKIFIAYKNTQTNAITVACIFRGAGAVRWTAFNVFSTTSIQADNVRIAFNKDGNLIIAASLDTDFLVTVLNATTGNPIALYATPLAISCGADVRVRQAIGISDGTIVLVGYDANADAMLAVRINAAGQLDTTFDSQGVVPGVAAIAIGDQIADYYARVGSGITVQSHTGSNQGNLLMSGYEQMFADDATPMVMRLFGEPGTTQVKGSSVSEQIPGTFDTSYNETGIAVNYVLGASTPAANQEVRAIRQVTGTQIMTLITDYTTSISYTQRLNADSTIDTTYGSGLGIAIAKLSGTEVVQSMEFDGSGNFLVTGSNSSFGGYIKRILPTGTMDQTFGGPNGNPDSTLYPLGTTYGLMDVVNACQQLTNGNIVIVGSKGGVGMVQMLSSTGNPITTFGVGGQVTSGTNITSVSVDGLNNIYAVAAYLDGIQMNARIIKLNASGQLVTAFGDDGMVNEALAAIDNDQNLRLVFDAMLQPIVAASAQEVGNIVVNRFTVDGLVDMTFHGGTQTIISLSPATSIATTGLVALQNNNILIAGYKQDSSTPANNKEFIACLTSAGELDFSFGNGVAIGIVMFGASDTMQLARKLITMNVQTDGSILVCGGEVPEVNQETPVTFRFYGYPNVQAVRQFVGYQPNSALPSVLNPSFNGTGISATPSIANLSQVGNVALDKLGRSLVGGVTSTGLFTIARYLNNGLLDTLEHGGTGFGVDGIAQSITPISGLFGGHIVVDSMDNIYIGGVAASDQLIVARFTPEGILDSFSFGSGGITASIPITYLFDGGFVTVDNHDKPLVAGYTSSGDIVVTRFLTNGTTDTTFAVNTNNIASQTIPSLLSGGSIVTDAMNSVYVGGLTSVDTMFVTKFNSLGTIQTGFGIDGIASTSAIPQGLVDGGALAINRDDTIVTVGGLTTNQTFVLAQFLAHGSLNPLFNSIGIAYSNPVDVLDVFGNITIDSDKNIIVGGIAKNYDDSQSMIVARFTPRGILDTTFTSSGMATTGAMTGLAGGGTVVTDVYDNIFVAGLTDLPGFVMAKMYGGLEIFITNPATLTPVDLKTFYYGNSPDYLLRILSPEFYAQLIKEPAVRQEVLTRVAASLALYIVTYRDQPGWNLVWHAYRALPNLNLERLALILSHAADSEQINEFFTNFQTRIMNMEFNS